VLPSSQLLLGTKTSWTMTSEGGNRGASGIDASLSESWLTSPARSLRGLTSPSRANCPATSSSAKTLSAPKGPIRQRVWEIRIDSVLKLDRGVKRESNDDNHKDELRS